MLKRLLLIFAFISHCPLYSQDSKVTANMMSAHIGKLVNDCRLHSEKKPRLAISLGEEALRLLEKTPSNELKVTVLRQISYAWKIVGDYKRALEYAEQSLDLAKLHNLQFEEASAHKMLGDIEEKLGNYPIALEFYFESLSKYEELETQATINRLYNKIGIVYESLKDYEKALYYHQKALQEQQTEDKEGSAIALTSLANVYLKLGEKEKSLQLQNESIEIFRELGESEYLAKSMVSIGEACMSVQDISMARYYLEEALQLYQRYGDPWGIAQTRSKLAEIMIREGKIDEALYALNNSLKLAENVQAKHLIMNHKRLLYIAHKEKAESALALAYLEEFKKLNDELINAQTQARVSDLQSRYKIEKNSKAINILEKDKKIKEQEITLLKKGREADWHFKAMLLTLLLSSITILIFVYARYKGIKKSKRTLSRYNRDLHNAYESLKKINESKSELLGIAAHDLKNPLSGIISLTEVLEIILNSNLNEEDKMEVFEYLKTMKTSAEHMLIIIEDWINNEALDSGKITLDMSCVNITELTEDVVRMNLSQANDKEINLQFSANSDLQIQADQLKIREILDNLISNAIKYSPQDKKILVSVKNEEKHAIISILDEGPGFTKEDLEKAFQPFQRLSAQPTANEGSTGLGLSIAKKLTEIQNGRIEIHSETGNGAELILSFPLTNN